MAKFMIAYHGGNQPNSKEEGEAQMLRWKEWVQSLGEAVVNPGTPLKNSKIVTSVDIEDDSNPDSMKGFAVVEAGSIEAAIEIARSDPFIETSGRIRVSEMMEMK